MSNCITNIGLDCKAIIALDGISLLQDFKPCYKYGTELTLDFNQAVSPVQVPIVGSGTNTIELAGEYNVTGDITIAGSEDMGLNGTFTVTNSSYNSSTDTTTLTIGYTTTATDQFGFITLFDPCEWEMTYKVENSDTGEELDSGDESGSDDPLNSVIAVALNTIGIVKVTITFESCLGYQECSVDIPVCAETSFLSTCHDHVINYNMAEPSALILLKHLEGDEPDYITLFLTIYQIESDGSYTEVGTYTYDNVYEFEHLFVSSEDGIYYYTISGVASVDGEKADAVLISSGIIIDTCDIRACWANLSKKYYCCNCGSDCAPSDEDCLTRAKIEKEALMNALLVMSSDIFVILNLTEVLTNQWTTKNPVYPEDYKNDIVKLYEVINHLSEYIKNCSLCLD